MKVINVFFFLTVCCATWINIRAEHTDGKHLDYITKALKGKTRVRKFRKINSEEAQKVARRRRVTRFLSLLQ